MQEQNAIYGCFPDLRCMMSVLIPPGTEVSLESILYAFGALVVALIGVGFYSFVMGKKKP